jgi:predicted metal-binding membrane protein
VLAIFRRITKGRGCATGGAGRVGLFAAWFAFRLTAHAADALLHFAGSRSPTLPDFGWAIGAAALAGAGLFQFSALTGARQCTHRSRSLPRAGGRAPCARRGGSASTTACSASLLLGVDVADVRRQPGSLGWMLVLAAVMAAKSALGTAAAHPAGLGLLGWAGVIAIAHL